MINVCTTKMKLNTKYKQNTESKNATNVWKCVTGISVLAW